MNRSEIEQIFQQLAKRLSIPRSRYERAERSYKSVGEWLCRSESTLAAANPEIYVQGSFRLGTAIPPFDREEDYDVDLVSELQLDKTQLSQAELKERLGAELRAYARAHGMQPPSEGDRCWTLDYADGARFHLDTLPAIPDGLLKRRLLESSGLSSVYADTAIAITDRQHPDYRRHSTTWPHSNPKGYAAWFISRLGPFFEAKRKKLALEARASVEDIPLYQVDAPLQGAIRILKHHRDRMFAGNPDDKPISIILTTLAAHAYGQQETIVDAIEAILQGMDQHIEDRNGVAWIQNPTDPAENFADRWKAHPARKAAFYRWLRQARFDFEAIINAANEAAAYQRLREFVGEIVADDVRKSRGTLVEAFRTMIVPRHKQAPPWRPSNAGRVAIRRAIIERGGFRAQEFVSGSQPLPKHAKLTFEAETNIPKPYKVYWQVVNTGEEAERAGGLRGGFDEGVINQGPLTKREDTLYKGQHTIECFIIKNEFLAAQSGPFVVEIA